MAQEINCCVKSHTRSIATLATTHLATTNAGSQPWSSGDFRLAAWARNNCTHLATTTLASTSSTHTSTLSSMGCEIGCASGGEDDGGQGRWQHYSRGPQSNDCWKSSAVNETSGYQSFQLPIWIGFSFHRDMSCSKQLVIVIFDLADLFFKFCRVFALGFGIASLTIICLFSNVEIRIAHPIVNLQFVSKFACARTYKRQGSSQATRSSSQVAPTSSKENGPRGANFELFEFRKIEDFEFRI